MEAWFLVDNFCIRCSPARGVCPLGKWTLTRDYWLVLELTRKTDLMYCRRFEIEEKLKFTMFED